MGKRDTFLEKWNEMIAPARPGLEKTGSVISTICRWIYRLRALILAIPVVIAAIRLAAISMDKLPEMVGINLLANGEYSYMIAREAAVYGPLAVTALCLVLTVMSKKVLYPWLISLFSLAIPLVILMINVFPS